MRYYTPFVLLAAKAARPPFEGASGLLYCTGAASTTLLALPPLLPALPAAPAAAEAPPWMANFQMRTPMMARATAPPAAPPAMMTMSGEDEDAGGAGGASAAPQKKPVELALVQPGTL